MQKLDQYGRSDVYPLHMPGHKRRISHFEHPFSIDITEIEGFDNLFHAEGVLLEAQRRAARLYGADETYYLVNGSSCGILAAVAASMRRGGRILMSRNSHKASYHAAFLNGLHVTYLYPETDLARGISGAIRPETVESALEQHSDIQAVLVTSPTYDGIESDLERIARAAHQAGVVLIVDAAHGAHFGMHPYFPKHALESGADIVINSLHKTLPSLTQTALLHVNGPMADRERIRKYLGIYQSSSPSYVLMAGMDACIDLLETQGEALFRTFAGRLEHLRRSLEHLRVLHLVNGRELYCYDYDRSKILISTERSQITGPWLAGVLRRKYHLEPEMEAEHYVTAIMTIADTQEGFERLERALLEIDAGLAGSAEGQGAPAECREDDRIRSALAGSSEKQGVLAECREDDRVRSALAGSAEKQGVSAECAGSSGTGAEALQPLLSEWPAAEEVFGMEEAEGRPRREVLIQDSRGMISAEYVYLYPPGIPLLVPGERIPDGLPEKLRCYQTIGLRLQGLADYTGRRIQVIEEAEI